MTDIYKAAKSTLDLWDEGKIFDMQPVMEDIRAALTDRDDVVTTEINGQLYIKKGSLIIEPCIQYAATDASS